MSNDPRTAQSQPKAISLLPILSVNFVGTLGFSIVLPFLIFIVTRFGGNAVIYGIMGATYSAFQLIGAPILGTWSDKYGRRKILLLSQLGTLFSWCVFLAALYLPADALVVVDSELVGAFTLTLPLVVLFAARAIDGLTGGNVSVANAYLADITDEEHRSENFGKMAISANMGFIIGPAIAGILGAGAWGETPPVIAALLISVIATLIIGLRLPESRPCVLTENPEATNVRKLFGQEQKDCFEVQSAEKSTIRNALRLPQIPRLLLLHFLVFLGFNFFYIAFPVHAVQTLHWELTDTGIFFVVLGALMAFVQGPVLRRASRIYSNGILVTVGSLLLGASFLLFLVSTAWGAYTGAVLLALGNGLMWPSLLAIISGAAGDRHQGAVQGAAGSSGSFASILGLIVGGVLYEALGSMVFAVSAGILLTACAMSITLPKLQKSAGT